jgi:hypothetical protein
VLHGHLLTLIAQYSAPWTAMTSSGCVTWSASLSSQDRMTPNTGPKLYDTHLSSMKHWCWQLCNPGSSIRIVLITWPDSVMFLMQSRYSSCRQPSSPVKLKLNSGINEKRLKCFMLLIW